ncbi:hypothetical protein [Vulgatibacter sp.]|uniref:hypothetical protein n=1 Tax=Vulgatibacter sp. TaxID=1971226 RepID=UPI0035668533
MNLPMLQLRNRDGSPFSWPELWQRRNVLVLVAHGSCASCRRVLADWEEQADVLAAENTTPIAIFEEDPGETPPGVRVLVDPQRRFASQLGIPSGTVLAADRFFEVLEQEDVHAMGADEAASDSIEWVRLAERQCPECGVGTW